MRAVVFIDILDSFRTASTTPNKVQAERGYKYPQRVARSKAGANKSFEAAISRVHRHGACIQGTVTMTLGKHSQLLYSEPGGMCECFCSLSLRQAPMCLRRGIKKPFPFGAVPSR